MFNKTFGKAHGLKKVVAIALVAVIGMEYPSAAFAASSKARMWLKVSSNDRAAIVFENKTKKTCTFAYTLYVYERFGRRTDWRKKSEGTAKLKKNRRHVVNHVSRNAKNWRLVKRGVHCK